MKTAGQSRKCTDANPPPQAHFRISLPRSNESDSEGAWSGGRRSSRVGWKLEGSERPSPGHCGLDWQGKGALCISCAPPHPSYQHNWKYFFIRKKWRKVVHLELPEVRHLRSSSPFPQVPGKTAPPQPRAARCGEGRGSFHVRTT